MNKSSLTRQIIIFWLIVLGSMLIVGIVFSASMFYQYQSARGTATFAAMPTVTAQALEDRYQKGLAYLNIGRWQEAKTELEAVFETDSNYKDVQIKLKEVYTQISEPINSGQPGPDDPTPTSGSNSSPVEPTRQPDQPSAEPSQVGGLVAVWGFDESSGQTARNGTANQALAGTLNNFADTSGQDVIEGSGWTSMYKYEGTGALMFDGIDDYVRIPQPVITGGDFTICAWFNAQGVDTINHNSVIIGQQSTGLTFLAMYYQDTNTLGMGINAGANNILSNDVLSFNRWHFGCIRYGDNVAHLFVDGKKQQNSYTGSISYSGNEVGIGRNNYNGGQQYWQGVIDTVSVYQRALSDQEILDLYH